MDITTPPDIPQGEVETCRICRGEATDDEPLFHPCKCSGSIKYVHQDCLLEWLRHSKKSAVCELCNTSYRFTKLYSPDMPPALPLQLMIQRMAKDGVRLLLVTIRAAVVLFLWLTFLPYMSSVHIRVMTGLAETIPHKMEAIFLSPVHVLREALTLSGPTMISLPEFLRPMWPGKSTKAFYEFVIEGQVLLVTLVLIIFIVMIVREWVLQNEEFLEELRAIEVNPEPQADHAHLHDATAEVAEFHAEHAESDEDWVDEEQAGTEEEDEGDDEGQVAGPNDPLGNVENLRQRLVMLRNNNNVVEGDADVNPRAADVRNAVDRALGDVDALNQALQNRRLMHVAAQLRQAHEAGHPEEAQGAAAQNDDEANPVPAAVAPDHRGPAEPIGGVEQPQDIPLQGFLGAADGAEVPIDRLDPMDGLDQNPRNDFDDFDDFDDMDDGIDDVDGLLDMIGFRGPLVNLVSASSAAHLISGLTVLILYGLPYILGRLIVYATCTIGYPLSRYSAIAISARLFMIADLCLTPFAKIVSAALPSLSKWASRDALMARRHLLHGFMGREYERMFEPWTFPQVDMPIRFVVTLLGYSVIATALAFYSSSKIRFSRTRTGQRTERAILMILKQVEAVLKVIVVIGIELVVFPIFCGMLLHMSLLPLFTAPSLQGEVDYFLSHPITTTFRNWAIGTAYMFIFAMFVALCRRIMRSGVLYFVRDPNDANFHPIKEVLNRGLWIQLSRIALSALIYSVLIVVCLGGIIYALRYVFHVSYLPLSIQWIGSVRDIRSMLAVVVLFNVCIPALVRTLRSSTIMNAYWSRVFTSVCANLRLSSFILNVPVPQEQGSIYYGSLWARFLATPDYTQPVTAEQARNGAWDKAYFVRDGTFVRAPNTDSIPSRLDLQLFVTVTKDDERVDGLTGIQQNELTKYAIVYRPPQFRLRVGLFLVSLWITGILVLLAATILPLIMGKATARFVLDLDPIGDQFYFVIGAMELLSLLWVYEKRFELYRGFSSFSGSLVGLDSVQFVLKLGKLGLLAFLAVSVAAIMGRVLDLYVLLPFSRLILSAPLELSNGLSNYASGVLMMLLFHNVTVTRRPDGITAQRFRAMIQNGWWDYDVKIAVKYFAMPYLCAGAVAVGLPVGICWTVFSVFYRDASADLIRRTYELSYPVALMWFVTETIVSAAKSATRKWLVRTRDEAYLVGQQLENL